MQIIEYIEIALLFCFIEAWFIWIWNSSRLLLISYLFFSVFVATYYCSFFIPFLFCSLISIPLFITMALSRLLATPYEELNVQGQWIDDLFKSMLRAAHLGIGTQVLIARTSSVIGYAAYHVPVRVPLTSDLLDTLISSALYNSRSYLIIATDGTILALNATFGSDQLTLPYTHEKVIKELHLISDVSIITCDNVRQLFEFFTAKNHCAALSSPHARTLFMQWIYSGCNNQNISFTPIKRESIHAPSSYKSSP